MENISVNENAMYNFLCMCLIMIFYEEIVSFAE